MMNDFSLSMALVDFIPVILFAASATLLMRDLYNKMSKGAFALFSAGVMNVTLAGFLKAVWKLLFVLQICDFEALNKLFFPLQSIGFLLAGMGILAMLFHKQTGETLKAVAIPVFSGTILFVVLMIAGLAMVNVGLCILSVKLNKYILIILFVLSFLCSLGMGYLSSRDFTQASMNWIAEGVNVVGQSLLFAGVLLLHKNGLADKI